jgi:hypothetical protein
MRKFVMALGLALIFMLAICATALAAHNGLHYSPGLAKKAIPGIPPGLAKKAIPGIPPGLAKKAIPGIPPGLAKKAISGIPPGVAKKYFTWNDLSIN